MRSSNQPNKELQYAMVHIFFMSFLSAYYISIIEWQLSQLYNGMYACVTMVTILILLYITLTVL